MNKYNKADFLSGLASIDWIEIFSDPNRMTDAFHEIFESALKSHAAIKKRKVRTEEAPLLNITIKALMRECEKTRQLAQNDVSLWPKYKKLRNRVTMCTREAVKN